MAKKHLNLEEKFLIVRISDAHLVIVHDCRNEFYYVYSGNMLTTLVAFCVNLAIAIY